MKDKIKKSILDNKNDLIEGTFSYSLFEDSVFDEELLVKLIEEAKAIFRDNDTDREVEDVLLWVVQCVDQCFMSHHDKDDYFKIENYKKSIEDEWNRNWKEIIFSIINGGQPVSHFK